MTCEMWGVRCEFMDSSHSAQCQFYVDTASSVSFSCDWRATALHAAVRTNLTLCYMSEFGTLSRVACQWRGFCVGDLSASRNQRDDRRRI